MAWSRSPTAEQRAAEQQPGVDRVAAEPRGVGQGDHVGGEPCGPLGVAPGQQVARVLGEHGQPDRPRQRLAVRRRWAPTSGRGRAAGLGEQRRPGPPRARAPRRRRPGCRRRPRRCGPARGRSGPAGCARTGRSSARRSCCARAWRRRGRGGRLGEPALRGVDVGEGAGGLPADRPVRVELDRAPGLGLGAGQVAGVEVHLGADRGGLGQLLLGVGARTRRARRRGRAARAPRRSRAPRRRRCRPGGRPGRRSRADRRRWRGRPRGSRRRRGRASRCRGRRRCGWPPSSRASRVSGSRAGRRDRVAHGRQVAQPRRVGRTVVVVRRARRSAQREQPGADRGRVVGRRGEDARPWRGSATSMSNRPSGIDLDQAAAHQVAGELGGLRVDASSTCASTSRPTGKSSIADAGGEQRRWSSSSSSWAESHRLVEADRGIALAEPDQRDCTATCSISSGSPPVARSSRRTSCSWSARSTGCPPAASDAAQEQLDGRPSERPRARARGSGPTRTTRLGRLAGGRQRGDHHAGVGGRLEHGLQVPARPRSCRGRGRRGPAGIAPVDGAAEGARQRVARRGLGVEALQGRDEHVVEAAQAAGVDPRGAASRLRRRGARAASCRCREDPTTVTHRDSSSASRSARWTSSRPRHGVSTGRTYRSSQAGVS